MNATAHPFTPEEIMAFLDGELPVDRTQFVSAHIEQCPECRALTAEFQATTNKLSNWQVGKPSAPLEEYVLSFTENKQEPKALKLSWLRGFQLALSRPLPWALACLAFAILIVAQLTSQRPQLQGWMGRSTSKSVLESARPRVTPLIANEPNESTSRQAGGGGGDKADAFSNAEDINVDVVGKLTAQDLPKVRALGDLSGPMIARTVSLAILTKDFDASHKSLEAILGRHNGYAASLSVSTPQGAAKSIEASLRVPAPQLAATLTELRALGRVEKEGQNGEEVTQQHADLVARLKNSRETEQRLQAILAQRTGKIKDVLAVEQEIARVRGEIEQMEAEQKNLEHRVDFATIDLELSEEYKAQLNSPAPSVSTLLRNSLIGGLRTAADSVLSLVLFFSESGPVVLLWLAILAIPARQLWRRYRRAAAAI